MILKTMLGWSGRKLFGKIVGYVFPMLCRTISAAARKWLIGEIAELKKEAAKTETEADDVAVAFIEQIFGLNTNGPIDGAISKEFREKLAEFLDRFEAKAKTTINDIDDVACETLRGVFNLHQTEDPKK